MQIFYDIALTVMSATPTYFHQIVQIMLLDANISLQTNLTYGDFLA